MLTKTSFRYSLKIKLEEVYKNFGITPWKLSKALGFNPSYLGNITGKSAMSKLNDIKPQNYEMLLKMIDDKVKVMVEQQVKKTTQEQASQQAKIEKPVQTETPKESKPTVVKKDDFVISTGLDLSNYSDDEKIIIRAALIIINKNS